MIVTELCLDFFFNLSFHTKTQRLASTKHTSGGALSQKAASVASRRNIKRMSGRSTRRRVFAKDGLAATGNTQLHFKLAVAESEPAELEFESAYSTDGLTRYLYDFIRRS